MRTIQDDAGPAALRGDLLLLVGPESSGTRLFHDALSQHPDVIAHPDATSSHADLLDPVWEALAQGLEDDAGQLLRQFNAPGVLLTRRSMPHGPRPGERASYMGFPDLKRFVALCQRENRRPVLLITSRSPAAHLMSWSQRRASTDQCFDRAICQYLRAYERIFETVLESGCPFLVLSYEALVLDSDRYLQSVQTLLGLKALGAKLEIRSDCNTAHYERFLQDQASLLG